MTESVIIWDIETIPDLPGFAAANDLGGKSDDEIRVAMGSGFPKHLFHSIICIGALVADRSSDGWHVKVCGAPHLGDRSERQLIEAFVDKIAELKPQLVTFNGSSFDLPVLRYRAMIHEVEAPGLSARSYFNRYTEDALDLCDVLSSFTSQARASLQELSRILGLPGKIAGIKGSDVESYYLQGRIKEIANYCEVDVVNTCRVWLRYELFRGRLSGSEFDASEQNLVAFIKEQVGSKPHLAEFVGGSGDRR